MSFNASVRKLGWINPDMPAKPFMNYLHCYAHLFFFFFSYACHLP